MEIIRDELHCTAVRIGARDVGRLATAAEAALDADLDVWLSPALWDRDADGTQACIERAAEVAEHLRRRAPDRLVLVVGRELTLFMRGRPWQVMTFSSDPLGRHDGGWLSVLW